MWRMLFFFMGVPMMIMSFFSAIEVLSYATDYQVMIDGKTVEISLEEKEILKQKVEDLFENSHTMPAFGVILPEMYDEAVQEGMYVSIKFDGVYSVNELPFDELVFGVNKGDTGFNLMRGNKGVFQGRCIYLDLIDKDQTDLFEFLQTLKGNAVEEIQPEPSDDAKEEENQTQEQEAEEEKISN